MLPESSFSHARPVGIRSYWWQQPQKIERNTTMDSNPANVYPLLRWDGATDPSLATVAAGVLCLLAASIASAGGVGGGALYLAILNLIAGVDLKTASTFSAFMVTGGSLSNVLYNTWSAATGRDRVIDYDVALLSEPCMLLGVSMGVICNVVFPEWLVTLLFVAVIVYSTTKTCNAGVGRWMYETRQSPAERRVCGDDHIGAHDGVHGDDEKRRPLLAGEEESAKRRRFPWKKAAVLLFIWISFFLIQLLGGDNDGEGFTITHIKPCSTAYWLLTSSQIPLAGLFTAGILYVEQRRRRQAHSHNREGQKDQDVGDPEAAAQVADSSSPPKPDYPGAIFPTAALLAGGLGGLFGIGGGLLMNPVLLQIGVQPQPAAATSSFMVLFSSSMTSVQYLTLGMKNVTEALVMAMGCFVAALVGLVLIQGAVEKLGRASIIVFIVGAVMALSTVSITCFGAMDVWKAYLNHQYMGFNLPC